MALLFGIDIAALLTIDPLMALATLSFAPGVAWRRGAPGRWGCGCQRRHYPDAEPFPDGWHDRTVPGLGCAYR